MDNMSDFLLISTLAELSSEQEDLDLIQISLEANVLTLLLYFLVLFT